MSPTTAGGNSTTARAPSPCGGEPALARALELLQDEVTRCLGLLGVNSFSELNPSFIAPVQPLGRSWLDSAFPLLKEGY